MSNTKSMNIIDDPLRLATSHRVKLNMTYARFLDIIKMRKHNSTIVVTKSSIFLEDKVQP